MQNVTIEISGGNPTYTRFIKGLIYDVLHKTFSLIGSDANIHEYIMHSMDTEYSRSIENSADKPHVEVKVIPEAVPKKLELNTALFKVVKYAVENEYCVENGCEPEDMLEAVYKDTKYEILVQRATFKKSRKVAPGTIHPSLGVDKAYARYIAYLEEAQGTDKQLTFEGWLMQHNAIPKSDNGRIFIRSYASDPFAVKPIFQQLDKFRALLTQYFRERTKQTSQQGIQMIEIYSSPEEAYKTVHGLMEQAGLAISKEAVDVGKIVSLEGSSTWSPEETQLPEASNLFDFERLRHELLRHELSIFLNDFAVYRIGISTPEDNETVSTMLVNTILQQANPFELYKQQYNQMPSKNLYQHIDFSNIPKGSLKPILHPDTVREMVEGIQTEVVNLAKEHMASVQYLQDLFDIFGRYMIFYNIPSGTVTLADIAQCHTDNAARRLQETKDLAEKIQKENIPFDPGIMMVHELYQRHKEESDADFNEIVEAVENHKRLLEKPKSPESIFKDVTDKLADWYANNKQRLDEPATIFTTIKQILATALGITPE